MILKDGTEYEITTQIINALERAYPQVDILTEIRKAEAWCLCNPERRKTKRGITRFLNHWISRASTMGIPQSVPRGTSTRQTTLEQDLNDYSWAE